MYNNKTIAVVVPAYNEENQIGMVIEDMPPFVDRIVIVNDCSTDSTATIVKKYIKNSEKSSLGLSKEITLQKFNRADIVLQEIEKEELNKYPPSFVENADSPDDKIVLINIQKNSGVGAAIARGYKWCKDHEIDCTAVMAGDGQMDPSELLSICAPIIDDGVDYVKGNRLIHRSAWLVIPKIRYFGNSILSILTKIASGYWHVSDTQTGYTAISLKGLKGIRIYDIYKSYGMPNDLLVKLNISFCTLKEVEIKPVYGVGEVSKMKLLKVVPTVSLLLLISFFKRLWIKYLYRDFHPLFILYHFAILLAVLWIPYLLRVGIGMISGKNFSFETLFAFTFIGISCVQSFMFAMWMDVQDNERLYK
jgi:glycosyltransferase involved in cell wall biosynthesis